MEMLRRGPLRLRFRSGKMCSVQAADLGAGKPMGRGIMGIGIPLAAAMIHDLRQPGGFLRPLLSRILHRRPAIRLIGVEQDPGEEKDGYKGNTSEVLIEDKKKSLERE